MIEIALIRTGQVDGICYLSHYTSKIRGRRPGFVLVDQPVSFDHREPTWVSEDLVFWTMTLAG
jgi:hypothetical protein